MLKQMHYKILSVVLLCIVNASSWASETDKFGTAPVLNDGQKWRVVFYEGGPHANYYNYLEATIRGLMKLGWIEQSELKGIQSKKMDTKRLWNWLVSEIPHGAVSGHDALLRNLNP